MRGLQGGHSGLQIHQGLGNAVLLLARTLRGLLAAVPGLRVASLTAGDKRNAIPREGSALLLVGYGLHAAVDGEWQSNALNLFVHCKPLLCEVMHDTLAVSLIIMLCMYPSPLSHNLQHAAMTMPLNVVRACVTHMVI